MAESSLLIYEQIESPMAARVRQQLAKWRKELVMNNKTTKKKI